MGAGLGCHCSGNQGQIESLLPTTVFLFLKGCHCSGNQGQIESSVISLFNLDMPKVATALVIKGKLKVHGVLLLIHGSQVATALVIKGKLKVLTGGQLNCEV